MILLAVLKSDCKLKKQKLEKKGHCLSKGDATVVTKNDEGFKVDGGRRPSFVVVSQDKSLPIWK